MGKPRIQFSSLTRQKFRRFFQPSRIALALFPSASQEIPNVITLSFNMHCSYKPPMMAIAVQRGSLSYELVPDIRDFVLAIPGDKLAEETLFCGLRSGRDVNKVRECDFDLQPSKHIQTPGICSAIANIELVVADLRPTGDHITVVGSVREFGVNVENREKCLLSVGPEHSGYRVLVRHGIHRIGVPDVD